MIELRSYNLKIWQDDRDTIEIKGFFEYDEEEEEMALWYAYDFLSIYPLFLEIEKENEGFFDIYEFFENSWSVDEGKNEICNCTFKNKSEFEKAIEIMREGKRLYTKYYINGKEIEQIYNGDLQMKINTSKITKLLQYTQIHKVLDSKNTDSE